MIEGGTNPVPDSEGEEPARDQRTSPKGKAGRTTQLTLLLEGTLNRLLSEIARGSATPTTLADTLLESLQRPALLGARLDLPPPYPPTLSWSTDPELAEVLRQPLRPGARLAASAAPQPPPSALARATGPVRIPLRSRHAQAGTLSLWLQGGGPTPSFSARARKAIQGIADLLISGAELALLRDQITSSRALHRGLLAVGTTLDPVELQNTALSTAKHIFSCDAIWYLSYNEAQGSCTQESGSGPVPSSALPAVEASIASRQSCTLVLNNEQRAFASCAVVVGMRLLGILLLQRRDPFDRQALDLLDGLALGIGQGMRNAQIYQDFQETFAELHNALDQLIQTERLRALGEIARGVAHDFNNLLTIISSHAQFLEDGATAEQQQELDSIHQAVKEGSETVRRLREFTRAAVDESVAQVALNDLIVEAYHLVEPLIARLQAQREASITVELELHTVSQLSGSAPELREMVMHMLHNCLDALPTGGTVWVRTWESQGAIYLEVRDNGVGMPEDVRRRVFDPFFTTKALRGTGLGLSMVYGVIRRHGGSIDVKSVPGVGSTFTVRFPKTRGTILAEGED